MPTWAPPITCVTWYIALIGCFLSWPGNQRRRYQTHGTAERTLGLAWLASSSYVYFPPRRVLTCRLTSCLRERCLCYSLILAEKCCTSWTSGFGLRISPPTKLRKVASWAANPITTQMSPRRLHYDNFPSVQRIVLSLSSCLCSDNLSIKPV